MLISQINKINLIYILQAAIGALALDKVREVGGKPEEEILGKQILTIAVLSILITAPIGAAVIAITGPILLHQTTKEEMMINTSSGNKAGEDGYMST